MVCGRCVRPNEPVSPVVKEKRYFAAKSDVQDSGLPEDQSFWDKGVVSNHKVPEDIVPRVGSSRPFPGDISKIVSLAGGEDYGYFAYDAGDAGSSPATDSVSVWPNGKAPNVPLSFVPRPLIASFRYRTKKSTGGEDEGYFGAGYAGMESRRGFRPCSLARTSALNRCR